MTPPLIALSGKKMSGKTTLATALKAELHILTRSFAAPFKFGLQCMGVAVDGPDKDVKTLQDIGNYFRSRDPAWWVKRMAAASESRDQAGLIIDDLRFANEFAWCRNNGFLLVRLDVTRETQDSRAAAMGVDITDPEYGMVHHDRSETDLDEFPDWAWHLVLGEQTSVEERIALVLEALEKRSACVSSVPSAESGDLI